MTVIFYVKDYEVLISDEDADLATLHWHPLAKKDKNAVYIRKSSYDKTRHRAYTELIHRVVMSRVLGRALDRKEQVDHWDTNGLNNTRGNLRIATNTQNQGNQKIYKTNKVGLKGVTLWGKRYRATIQYNGKHMHIGMYDTPELAHAAYLEKAKEFFGDFARGE